MKMIDLETKKQYIQIAQMYYEQNMTQSEIAAAVGINRTSISRILKKLREEGIVKIIINYAMNDISLAQRLKNRFHLKEAIVVPVEQDDKQMKLTAIGQACAKYLDHITQDNDVIGFSWGSTLAEVVDALDTSSPKHNVFCIPLIGGPSGKLASRYHVNTICYAAARKFNGRSLMIDVPAIAETSSLKKDILETQYFREISHMWDQVNIAVFGIGSLQIAKSSTWFEFYGNESVTKFRDENVAGDVCSHFYDLNGDEIRTHITDRTISIPSEKLKRINYSIGVAESREKVPGIVGALNGHYVNVLITTKETAERILDRA